MTEKYNLSVYFKPFTKKFYFHIGVVPRFTQTPLSYMKMPTLSDAYLNFDIEIAFKPESMNGNLNIIYSY